MYTLKTVVVDDYQPAVDQLLQTLYRTCPQVEVIDHFPVAPDSLQKISHVSPDLVFFDAGGKQFSGIDILSDWQSPEKYPFIVTDSIGNYDPQHFSISITEFLPKPICPKRLVRAVDRVMEKNFFRSIRQEISQIVNHFTHFVQPNIHIPTQKGFDMIDHRKIIHAEAADNYAILHLQDGNQILSSQSLAKLEERLKAFPFLRIHRKSLVNLNHVCKYIKGDGGEVVLSNHTRLSVSRANKEALIYRLQHHCLSAKPLYQ